MTNHYANNIYSHKYQQLPLIPVDEFLIQHPEHQDDDENTLMVAQIDHERAEREALEQQRQELLKRKQKLIAENKRRKDDLANLDKDLEKFIDVSPAETMTLSHTQPSFRPQNRSRNYSRRLLSSQGCERLIVDEGRAEFGLIWYDNYSQLKGMELIHLIDRIGLTILADPHRHVFYLMNRRWEKRFWFFGFRQSIGTSLCEEIPLVSKYYTSTVWPLPFPKCLIQRAMIAWNSWILDNSQSMLHEMAMYRTHYYQVTRLTMEPAKQHVH